MQHNGQKAIGHINTVFFHHHQHNAMFPFAIYLLKVTICSGILFGYYWLILRNKVFHHYNRFYLLSSVLLSMTLPLVEINIPHLPNTPAPQAIQLLQVVNSNEYLDEMRVTYSHDPFSTEQALLILYIVISLVFLGLFACMLLRIRTLFVKHRHSLVGNIYFINTTARGTPFSFLKYIFWNDHIDPDSHTGNQIFKHELAHVQQKHSYDKLFINAVLIACWCNPFFWLIRKELTMIHEFVADKIAVEDSDTETFAAMILQASFPQHRFHLHNPFFYSPIKRRLLMLTKNQHPRTGYIGRIFVLPLALLVFAAFTFKAKTASPAYDGQPITVVIDAGHGGEDNGSQSINGSIFEKDIALAITKKIKALNSNARIIIILTRETDVYQSPHAKALLTKQHHADLFISIHTDGKPKEEADKFSGMSVWVAKDSYSNAVNSKLFASVIINEFSKGYKLPVVSNPQQRQAGIMVLQESPCPSVLIEAGYITNSNDLAFLQTSAAQETIAARVLAAIERYAFAKDQSRPETAALPAVQDKLPGSQQKDTLPEIKLKNIRNALIIIDGNNSTRADFKKIRPDLIKRVQVISGTVGVARFGQKGKNGVVIVDTRTKEIVLNNVNVSIHEKDSLKEIKIDKLELKVSDGEIADSKILFVVDGVVLANGFDMQSIDPGDVESIHVLKDKHATDKYGQKGLNGVVEIVTKTRKKKEIPVSRDTENTRVNTETALIYD